MEQRDWNASDLMKEVFKETFKEIMDDVINKVDNRVKFATAQTENNVITYRKEQINQFSELSEKTKKLELQQREMKDRMDILELQEEVTTEQANKITEIARKRINELIGQDKMEHQKYYGTFIRRLYSDCKKYAGLGHKIEATRKRDFQRVIDYIECWIPKSGCNNLKFQIDEYAKVKLKCKELGYA